MNHGGHRPGAGRPAGSQNADTAAMRAALSGLLEGQVAVAIEALADNLAVLRRRARDVVRRDTSKTPLSIKLKCAGWDDTFLRQLLNNISVT